MKTKEQLTEKEKSFFDIAVDLLTSSIDSEIIVNNEIYPATVYKCCRLITKLKEGKIIVVEDEKEDHVFQKVFQIILMD